MCTVIAVHSASVSVSVCWFVGDSLMQVILWDVLRFFRHIGQCGVTGEDMSALRGSSASLL